MVKGYLSVSSEPEFPTAFVRRSFMMFTREELLLLASNTEALVDTILDFQEQVRSLTEHIKQSSSGCEKTAPTAANRLLPTDQPNPKQRAYENAPEKSPADKRDMRVTHLRESRIPMNPLFCRLTSVLATPICLRYRPLDTTCARYLSYRNQNSTFWNSRLKSKSVRIVAHKSKPYSPTRLKLLFNTVNDFGLCWSICTISSYCRSIASVDDARPLQRPGL